MTKISGRHGPAKQAHKIKHHTRSCVSHVLALSQTSHALRGRGLQVRCPACEFFQLSTCRSAALPNQAWDLVPRVSLKQAWRPHAQWGALCSGASTPCDSSLRHVMRVMLCKPLCSLSSAIRPAWRLFPFLSWLLGRAQPEPGSLAVVSLDPGPWRPGALWPYSCRTSEITYTLWCLG